VWSPNGKGHDTSRPLAFIGLVTMALGAKMLLDAFKQTEVGRTESDSPR
jgi:hypothetical protein